MAYFESILRVLLVGLVLGAGLPALFAIGLTAFSRGAGDMNADGTSQAANPALKFLGLLLFLNLASMAVVLGAHVAAGWRVHRSEKVSKKSTAGLAG